MSERKHDGGPSPRRCQPLAAKPTHERSQPRRESAKKEIAGAAAPLGRHPPMDKEHQLPGLKCQRESTTAAHPHAVASRSRRSLPTSAASRAGKARKKKSPALPRRSAATRQWIKSTNSPA